MNERFPRSGFLDAAGASAECSSSDSLYKLSRDKVKRNSRGARIGRNLLIPVVIHREKSMTVTLTNRSHRIAYMVLLLLVAVALTSALVLAGERNWGSEKKEVPGRIPAGVQNINMKAELTGWRCA
jgi:hypothetical protein